jgi:hypothetical protein
MKQLIALLALAAGAAPAFADGQYQFMAPPENDLNRVYRVDRVTGEMGACQYAIRENDKGVGVTLCYKPGEGAGPQTPGEYALLGSHHEHDGAVFRLDLRGGAMSICYVLSESVVCTPSAR